MPINLSGSLVLTGSLTSTLGFTGPLSGTASYSSNADMLDGLDSTVFTQTGSFNTFSSSILSYTSSANSRLNSIETVTGSNITRLNSLENKTGSYATTGSNIFIGTQTISGSIFGSGSLTINGCITSTGQIVAQTINVQQVTSSIVYSCGSNIFGTSISNTQQLTGSVGITGSLTIAGGSSATSYSGVTIFGSTITCSPIGCFTTSCATSFIGGTMSGTTIYGSTAICSAVGKFTSCIDAGSGMFSSTVTATAAILQSANTAAVVDILTLYNPSVVSSGVRQLFNNGYGNLAALKISQRDNGALADDGQIEFQVASNSVLGTKLTLLNTGEATFSSTITGTTIYSSTAVCSPVGKFTSCIDAGSGTFSSNLVLNASNNQIRSGNELRFYRTDNGVYTQLYDGGNPAGFILDNRNGNGFDFQSNATSQFKISSTGAATFTAATQDAIQTVVRMSGNNASSQLKALDFKLTAGTPLWTISTAATGTDAGINIMPNGNAGLSLTYAGAASFACSVGIGTISPCYKLDIRNASGTGAQTIVSVVNKTNDSNTGAFIGFGDAYTDTVSPYLFAARVGGTREGAGDGGYMSFYTRPTSGFEYERMRITAGGIACFACQTCTPQSVITSGFYSNSNMIIITNDVVDGRKTILNNTPVSIFQICKPAGIASSASYSLLGGQLYINLGLRYDGGYNTTQTIIYPFLINSAGAGNISLVLGTPTCLTGFNNTGETTSFGISLCGSSSTTATVIVCASTPNFTIAGSTMITVSMVANRTALLDEPITVFKI